MSSNILSGDRRWASARRGGMTVLGKVAVPKPLNLPSQRHENHGLDPNVEIVPRGTLSWGSRPSSSGSNPWVSVASPSADGVPGSPGHPSGRPSSGGSATRPSTSGSDKQHETITYTSMVSTSRPSSSSGTLSSNHTSSTPLRPRSAENRPTSSHLSRFAEPVPKRPVAWGPSIAAEKMGVKSVKEDGFSLSSGDFPNLGSGRDNVTKNNECEGYSRPTSASSQITQTNEEKTDVKSEFLIIPSTDSSPRFEDGKNLATGKRRGEPPQCFNANPSRQPFDTWRGPPMNGPAGIWYGGHPGGPAVGIPNTPGGFPVDAFPYYHHQMHPPPLTSSQPPPPGTGPRGPHPKGGDAFRPHMPDAFASPNMPPFRPGFYPGPPAPMLFEGYYRPPMGYCNNERDVPPFIGIAAGHPVYNGFRGPGGDTSVSHGRPASHVPSTKASSEQTEVGYPVHSQAPKRSPEGNHDEYIHRDGAIDSGRKLPMIHSRKSEWGAEEETAEVTFSNSETPNHSTSPEHQHAGHSAENEMKKLHVGVQRVKEDTDSKSMIESGGVLSIPQGMLPNPVMSERDSSYAAGAKNSTLIQKINSLNAKVRMSDGQTGPSSDHYQEDDRNESQFAESCVSKGVSSVAHGLKAPVGRKAQPTAVLSRKPYQTKQIADHLVDNQKRRPLSSESWSAGSARQTGSITNANTHAPDDSGEYGCSLVMNPPGNEGDLVKTHVSIDIQEQRTKMRELAKQRAMQLEKEEEERMREQKAKALAKLEELNRRTLSSDSAGHKVEKMVAMGENHTSGEVQRFGEPGMVDTNSVELGRDEILIQDDTAVNPSCSEKQDGHFGCPKHEASESGDVGITNYQTEDNTFLKSMTEKSGTVVSDTEIDDRDAALSYNLQSEAKMTIAKTSKAVALSSATHRKRNIRNIRYKHQSNETFAASAHSEAMPSTDSGEVSIENAELKNSIESHLLSSETADTIVQEDPVPNEESDRKVSAQWKPHHRRFQKSQQGNRFVEKLHSNDNVIWAPVRNHTKAEANVESSKKPAEVSANSTNDDSTAQNAPKGKRAEMERYVPKPIAMELAQQSGTQHLSSSKSVGGPQKEQSGMTSSGSMATTRTTVTNVGSDLNTDEGDVRPVKHKKDSVTWRRRADSSETKVTEPHPEKGLQQSKEPPQSVKSNLQPSGHETKPPCDLSSYGNELLSDAAPAMNRNQSAKAPLLANRAKRQINRGSRSTFNHHDSEFASGNEVYGNFVQSRAPDGNQTDRGNVTRENRSFGERISTHWQPKSQANPSNEQNRTQGLESESAAEVNKHSRKVHHQQRNVHEELAHSTESSRVGQSLQEHANAKRDTTVSNAGQLKDFGQDKRLLPESAQDCSPSENPEPAPNSSNDGHQREKNFHSGARGNVRQNNRSSRVHDSRGEWPSGHDNWHSTTAQEKPRQNVRPDHPVGNKVETANDQAAASNSSQRQGPRKVQSQTRRVGNYYRRQSSPPSADVGATG